MPEQKTTPVVKPVPVVRAKNRGQISTTLERYAAAYRSQNPDRGTRYVYDPEHKPELSGVLGREAAGYELVRYKDLGLSFEGMEPEKVVRVADLVLMSITREAGRKLQAERNQEARDQLTSVQRKYYDDIEQMAEANKSEHHTRPGARPVGSTVIAEKDFEYDINQRKGEEE